MPIPTDLLESFCTGFLGYGNPLAPSWFIGMEEGGGKTEAEILARLSAWERRGKQPIEDLRGFCRETGHPDLLPYASTNAPRDNTWCGLIKAKWQHEGKYFTPGEVLSYQRTEWLSSDGDACLLILMPLPSPGVKEWRYAAWNDSPFLGGRKYYMARFLDTRIRLIRGAITSHGPKQVVFVGKTYQVCWGRIAAGLTAIETETLQHPAAQRWHSR